MQVRDMGVVAVALNSSKLTALGLHCCRRLTDASMAACALKLRHLSSLNISGCLSMSPAAVQVTGPHTRGAANLPACPSCFGLCCLASIVMIVSTRLLLWCEHATT